MKKSLKITVFAVISALIITAGTIVGLSAYHNSPAYILSLAERYLDELNYEQAIVQYERYLAVVPDNDQVWLALADAYEKSGDKEGSKSALERAVENADSRTAAEKLKEIGATTAEIANGNFATDETPGSAVTVFSPDGNAQVSLSGTTDVEPSAVTTTAVTSTVLSTASTTETPAPVGDPLEIERMLLAHIRNGDSIDNQKLASVTKLVIYGEDFVFAECGDIKGTPRLSVSYNSSRFSVNDVDYAYGNIRDFSFLEACINLESLTINFNNYGNISFVNNLTRLKELSLMCMPVENTSELADLIRLEDLNLNDAGVEDISFLKNLTNLIVLNLSNNNINDISAVGNLKKLAVFYVTGEHISDVSSLEKLTSPVKLNLYEISADEEQIERLRKIFPDCEINYSYRKATGSWTPAGSTETGPVDRATAFENAYSYYDTIRGENNYYFVYLNGKTYSTHSRVGDASFTTAYTTVTDDIYNPTSENFHIWYSVPQTFDCEVVVYSDINGTHYQVKRDSISDKNIFLPTLDAGSTDIYLDVFDGENELFEEKEITPGKSAIVTLSTQGYYGTSFDGEVHYSMDISSIFIHERGPTYTATEIEEMILSHIKNGTPLNKEALKDVTELCILGEDVVFVVSKYSVGSIPNSTQRYHDNYNSFSINGNTYPRGNLSDISFVRYMPNLTTLFVEMNEIEDISVLSELQNLVTINFTGNEIEDISSLAEIEKLVNAELSLNNISDISPLAECKYLMQLGLMGNKISDISPLGELLYLQTLVLSSNRISDISALSNLSELKSLAVDDNNITDIEPILSLNKIHYLYVAENDLTGRQIWQLNNTLDSCVVESRKTMWDLILEQ